MKIPIQSSFVGMAGRLPRVAVVNSHDTHNPCSGHFECNGDFSTVRGLDRQPQEPNLARMRELLS